MVKIASIAVWVALTSQILEAHAQGVQKSSTPSPLAQAQLRCADFRRNADGSWSPVRPVQIGAATLGVGVSIRREVTYAGVSPAQDLDARCRFTRSP
jgi:hypothetical protein